MGKVSRYDAGDLPEDARKRQKTIQARVVRKPEQAATEKKPRALSLKIRDLRRLMQRYSDDESQKNLQERLDRLLRRQEYRKQSKERTLDQKRRDNQSRKMRVMELKKLQKKLKKVTEATIREMILNDMDYIRNFPRDRQYLSLFDTSLTDDQTKLRDQMRKEAAQKRMRAVEKGEKTADDDDDKLNDDFFQEAEEDEEDENED